MILYLTTQEHTNLLDFLQQDNEDYLPVKKMTGSFRLKQFCLYDMRNFSHYTELVLDRAAFGEEDAEFVEAIEEFQTMYNARVTVIAESRQERDDLFHGLLEAGVGNIVTAPDIKEMQEEIREAFSAGGMQKYHPSTGGNKSAPAREQYSFRAEDIRIAVVGAQGRIGVTTAALGLTAWLGEVGADVCYVDRNGGKCLPYIAEAYGMVQLENGYELDGISYGFEERVGKQFAVFDCGTNTSVENADVLLLICGVKPFEIEKTLQLLQQYETTPAFILCPFVEDALRQTYVEALGTQYHNILFLEYQPDIMNGQPNAKTFKILVEKYIN